MSIEYGQTVCGKKNGQTVWTGQTNLMPENRKTNAQCQLWMAVSEGSEAKLFPVHALLRVSHSVYVVNIYKIYTYYCYCY